MRTLAAATLSGLAVVSVAGAHFATAATDARAAGPVVASHAPSWSRAPDLPLASSGRFAGVSHGALIVAGGAHFPTPLFEGGTKVWTDAVDVLESWKAGWKSGFRLERPLAYGGSATVGDGVICAGGSDAGRHYRQTFRLEWRGGKVERTPLPDLPRTCAMSGAAAIGTTVYLVGGQETPASTEAMHTLWALDLKAAEPRWQELEPWPGPARILPVVVAHEGSLYVVSGAALFKGEDGKAARRYLKDAYRFTPGKGWERIADLPRPAVAAPAASWSRERLLVFGGDDGANASRVWELKEKHPGFSRDVLAYDTKAGAWSKAGTLPAGLVTTNAVAWDGGIAIPGGEDRPGHRSPQVLWLALPRR